MECAFHCINLPCVNLAQQSGFVSFLFDIEIMMDNEGAYFYLSDVRINLVESSSSSAGLFPAFELRVGSQADLANFKQKLELYAYKSSLHQIKTSFNSSELEFEDPSGNLWKLRLAELESLKAPSRASSGASAI